MHLVNKIFMFRIALYAAAIFGAIFIVLSAWGIVTVVEAQRWSYHTNTVLDQLALCQQRISAADQAGRLAITDSDARTKLPTLRDTASQEVASLRLLTTDNPHQQINLDALDTALHERFRAQDGQIASVKVDGSNLIFSDAAVIKSALSSKMLEDGLDNIRRDELRLLGERMLTMVSLQLRLTVGSLVCALLSGISSVVMLFQMLKDLKKQRALADQLRVLAMEKTEDGQVLGLSENALIEMANKIDGALGNDMILRSLVML